VSTADPREYWDNKAATFASGERERRSGRFRELYEECCWRYIEPVLPRHKDGLILEAGCGTGRWVFRLAPRGFRFVLADLSAEMIRYARERVEEQGIGEQVIACHALDICDMQTLSSESFDLVLALGVPLTLSNEPGRAVDECFRVTKSGGHIVCDAANRYRTALELARQNDVGQFAEVLATRAMSNGSPGSHTTILGPRSSQAYSRPRG